jgi:site-specific recombinase XerC
LVQNKLRASANVIQPRSSGGNADMTIPDSTVTALPTVAEGVKATMRGIRRTYGSARLRKAPAVAGKMLGMVATAPDELVGLRDRALLLIGLGGALRRSELVALDVADIEETETGLLVTIRSSKTDQEPPHRHCKA